MWLRLHRPPKKVARIRAEFRNAKQRWLFDRSMERYAIWPEGIKTNAAARVIMSQGEIGRIEGFGIYKSEPIFD